MNLFTFTPLHILWAGHEAVLLFFILSGFVLSLPFVRKQAVSYKFYAIRRICRIYIPYIAIMMLYVAVITYLGDYSPIPGLSKQFNARWAHPVTMDSLKSIVLMQGFDMANTNGVVWSLIHELRISLIFPLIILMLMKLGTWLGLGIGVPLVMLLRFGLFYLSKQTQDPQLAFTYAFLSSTAYYTPFFFFGAALAKNFDKVRDVMLKLRPYQKLILTLVAFTVICFRWVAPEFYEIGHGGPVLYGMLIETAGEWIISLGIILLFSIVLGSPLADYVLTRKPLIWLGKVSYSLYLMHVMVIMLSARYLSQYMPMELVLFLPPILSLPLAGLTYRFIEAPAMELGKRLTTVKK